MIPPSHHGTFAGLNRLWFFPGDPARTSDGELEVAADRVTLRWAYEGKPQSGSLALSGPPSSCKAVFLDTFHAADGLVLHGRRDGAKVALYTTYPAGEGKPDWGWRVELDWSVPDAFLVRMFNIKADDRESIAVDLPGVRVA